VVQFFIKIGHKISFKALKNMVRAGASPAVPFIRFAIMLGEIVSHYKILEELGQGGSVSRS